MTDTSIEWTRGDDGTPGKSWNPIRGCSRVSPGCENCYAEMIAARFSGAGQAFEGFAEWRLCGNGKPLPHTNLALWEPKDRRPHWTGRVELMAHKLVEPLQWRKPRRVFTNSTADLFHENLSDEDIAAIFGVMIAASQHTFIVLTKRAARMRAWMTHRHGPDIQKEAVRVLDQIGYERGCGSAFDPDEWPPPNVWLGVSMEAQGQGHRIWDLLNTPAAVRIASLEPLLSPVDLDEPHCDNCNSEEPGIADDGATPWCVNCDSEMSYGHWLDPLNGALQWVLVGGESGRGARPCDIENIRAVVKQCREEDVPVFVKQLGARPVENGAPYRARSGGYCPPRPGKHSDPGFWPEDLRIQEFPR